MKASDMIFDFLETLFLIFLISFVVFYFIAGDRLELAGHILKIIFPFAVFGIVFLSKIKFNQRELRRLNREGAAGKAVIYPTKVLIKWDLRVIIIISFIILLIPFVNKTFSIIDALQAFVFGGVMYAWHQHLFFTKDSPNPDKAITRAQVNKDEIFIFLLPIIVLIPSLLARRVNELDIIQAIAALALMFAWRKYFYYKLS